MFVVGLRFNRGDVMVYANTFFAGANMTEDILKLVAAVLVGGLIGFERQFRHGTGLRTMMLVCLGATMFTLYSDLFAFQEGDPRRIAAAVVTGVGFLGAGMILRYRGGVMGLTTAATVWLVAALGMGIGIDQYVLVGVATILVLIVLWGLPHIRHLTNARETYSFEVVCALSNQKYKALYQLVEDNGLHITASTATKQGDQMTCLWRAYGKPADHDQVMQILLDDPEVIEFRII
jgi:putative Mg2+ transporter-C (MgtC) family protein